MKPIFVALLVFAILPAFAQTNGAGVDMDLQPYAITKHGNPLRPNLRFAGFSTSKFRRKITSGFTFRKFNIKNELLKVHGVPLYNRDKSRSSDHFSFTLKNDSGIVSRTVCKAILRKDEVYNAFKNIDTLSKNNNVDYLTALIDTHGHLWELKAGNLNGSTDDEREGAIVFGARKIAFISTTRVLREEAVGREDVNSLFTSANLVYLFTYNGQDVAAIGLSSKHNKFWCREDLENEIKAVVASAACVLAMRINLYH